MKRAEAEKLLGGYATGTLTESERRMLLEAALEHQDLFDALADEDVLRELLSDPEARAQLLAALAPASERVSPKVVPFWRRPGVLGAAAGLIVATTAGLAVLRSPQDLPRPAVTPEGAAAPSPEAKAFAPAPPAKPRPKPEAMLNRALEAPAAAAPAPMAAAAPAPVAPPPVPLVQAVGSGAPAEEARARMQAESRRMEAREEVAKKVEAADRYRSAAMDVMAAASPAPRVAGMAPPPAMPVAAPAWSLEPLPDGATRVRVRAAPEAHVALLRRNRSGAEALRPEPTEASGSWSFRVRLAPGDALDLYVLNAPAENPAWLPEAGPVDGFRARIHPAVKKDAPH